MTPAQPTLEHGGVHWPANFTERVAALRGRLGASALARESAGAALRQGPGEDLVGYRPYRPGEDLRQLDWNLLARLEKPYVRITRQEAGELWVIVLDASASMGVGPPGKLQRAAECAAALWGLAAQGQARVRLVVSPGEGEVPRVLEGAASMDLNSPMKFLAEQRAAGDQGLASVLNNPRWFRGAARVFCLGDLLDEPARELLDVRQRLGHLRVLQWLAPGELEPAQGAVEWWDPETGERMKCEVNRADLERYRSALERRLETWRLLAAKHRFGFMANSSARTLEEVMGQLIRS